MKHELATAADLVGATVADVIRGWRGDLAIVTDRGFVCLHAWIDHDGLRIVSAGDFDEREFGEQETARLREAVAKALQPTTPGA